MIARAEGCLLGLLVGDALGSEVEFQSADDIRQGFPDGVREMTDGGTWDTLAGQPTDDGEMMITLARSLVERGKFDAEHTAKQYVYWLMSDPFDRGNTITQALEAGTDAMRVNKLVASGCHDGGNSESQANGGLMRVAPIGLLDAPLARLVEYASIDTGITHPNSICRDASGAYVAAISACVRDGVSTTWNVMNIAKANAHTPEVIGVLEAARAGQPPEDSDSRKAGWVLIALQGAFYELLHATSFEDGIVSTIMRGGDTDTTAAITGALLGAAWGADKIPERWRDAVLNCKPHDGTIQPRPKEYWTLDIQDIAAQITVCS